MNVWIYMGVSNVRLNRNTHIHVSAGNKTLKVKLALKTKLGSFYFCLISLCGPPGWRMHVWIAVVTNVLCHFRGLCQPLTPCMLFASDWMRFMVRVMAGSLHLPKVYSILLWANNSLNKYVLPENYMPHIIQRECRYIFFLSYSKVSFEIESMLCLLSVGLIKSLSYVKGTRASVFFSICHSCCQFSSLFPIPPLLLSYICSKVSILSKLKGLFLHTTFQSAACNLLWSVLLHLGARSEP